MRYGHFDSRSAQNKVAKGVVVTAAAAFNIIYTIQMFELMNDMGMP